MFLPRLAHASGRCRLRPIASGLRNCLDNPDETAEGTGALTIDELEKLFLSLA